jgi:hypothetical protein
VNDAEILTVASTLRQVHDGLHFKLGLCVKQSLYGLDGLLHNSKNGTGCECTGSWIVGVEVCRVYKVYIVVWLIGNDENESRTLDSRFTIHVFCSCSIICLSSGW